MAGELVVDRKGKKPKVILPLREYQKPQEDLHRLAIVAERRSEKPVSSREMKRQLSTRPDIPSLRPEAVLKYLTRLRKRRS